jgi:hypothetical protein
MGTDRVRSFGECSTEKDECLLSLRFGEMGGLDDVGDGLLSLFVGDSTEIDGKLVARMGPRRYRVHGCRGETRGAPRSRALKPPQLLWGAVE